MSRRVRIALIVLGVLVLLRIALPFVLRPVLASQLSGALGRPVSIGAVELSFTRGVAAIEELWIGEGEHALVHVERAAVNLRLLEFFSRGLRVETVELDSPAIALRLFEDGTLEPFVLASEAVEAVEAVEEVEEVEEVEASEDEPSAPPSEPAGSDPPAEPEEGVDWPIHVDELLLSDFTVLVVPEGDSEDGVARFELGLLALSDFSIVDGLLDFGSVRLEKPSLSVPRDIKIAPAGGSGAESASAPPEKEAPASEGGPLITGSDLTIQDAELELKLGEETVTLLVYLNVRDVSFAEGERFPVELRLDREGGSLAFEGEAGVQPVALDGTLKLDKLSLSRLLMLANPEIAARIEKGLLSGELSLDVGVEDAGVRVAVDGGLSIADLAANAEDRHVVTSATRLELGGFSLTPRASGEPAISAKLVSLEFDGLGLRDDSVEPSALVELPKVRIKTEGVRLPERDLTLDLQYSGLGGDTGSTASQLVAGAGKTRIEIDSFPISPFSGYARGAGFLLNGGSASLDGEIDSAGTAHAAAFDVTIDNLEIETIDASLFEKNLGMSPGLALAVLEDPTGSVRLPVKLEIDTASGGTGISIAQLMTGALRQAVMGVVTAPLKGIGFVAGGVLRKDGRLAMDPIAFKSGSTRLLEGQDEYIKAMARSLSARPLAGIRIVGRASEDETRRPERLAEKRAKQVYEALIEAGADPAALELAPASVGESGVVLEVGARPRAES